MRISTHTIKYSLLIGIALIWGSQFVFNTAALQQLPPLMVAVCRSIIGALTLSIVLSVISHTKFQASNLTLTLKHYGIFFLIGIFEAALPFYLVAWGQQHVDSSTAAILMSTIPIFTVLLVVIFVSNESINRYKIGSIILGFTGILVMLEPQAVQHSLVHPNRASYSIACHGLQ